MNMKNIVKIGLVGAMALTALFGSTIATQARGWGGDVEVGIEAPVVDENHNEIPDEDENYIISESYLDLSTGAALKPSTTAIRAGGIEYIFDRSLEYLDNLIEGYQYVGYSYTSSYGTTSIHSGGQGNLLLGVPQFTMKSERGIGVYDVQMFWEIDETKWATLSYDPGIGTGTMEPHRGLKGETVTIKENSFTNGNRRFVGWSINDDNTVGNDDEVYQPGSSFALTENLTLYAVWEEEKTTVNFYGNREDGYPVYLTRDDVEVDQFTMEVSRGYTLTVPSGFLAFDATPEYYGLPDYSLFLGWTTVAGSPVVEYRVGDQIMAEGRAMDFYAVWGYFGATASQGSDRSSYYYGDTIYYWTTFTADIGANSIPLYDYVQEIGLAQEYVAYIPDSIQVYINGTPVNVTLVKGRAQDGLQYYSFTLPVVFPGDVVRTNISATALRSFTSNSITLRWYGDGVVIPSPRRSSRAVTEPETGASRFGGAV